MPVLDIGTGGRKISLDDVLITLKMEAVRPSETLANFYRPTGTIHHKISNCMNTAEKNLVNQI
jgi:hypothetical protein